MPALRRLFATCLLAAAFPRGAGAETDADLDLALAVSRAQARAAAVARRSTVAIRCRNPAGFGSGVVVEAEGIVLTALHVVATASEVLVTAAGGAEREAEVFARDPASDLALLRLREGPPLRPCAFAAGDAEPGETLLAVGNPFGLEGSVSRGVVAAVGRRNAVPGNAAPLLQTDAPINPGSSGGPLVNLRGEVVGIVTAIFTRTGASEGVAFAVPSTEILRALPSLLAGSRPQRPWLGVSLGVRPSPEGGLEVLGVDAGGPSERAGIRPGDRIERINGLRLLDTSQLRRAIQEAGIGGRIRVDLIRGSTCRKALLNVEAMP